MPPPSRQSRVSASFVIIHTSKKMFFALSGAIDPCASHFRRLEGACDSLVSAKRPSVWRAECARAWRLQGVTSMMGF